MTNVISQQCDALSRALANPVACWREVVHPFLVRHFQRQFDTAGAHGGKPWASLEPKYAEAQRELGDSLTPLEASKSRVLEPSFTNPTDSNHDVQFRRREMRYRSLVPYASSLRTGGVGPYDEPFPPRDPTVMTKRQKDELIEKVSQWFLEKAGVRNA